jgi:hypothetical protein
MKRTVLVVVASLLAVATAHAVTMDHLKCHKMKDPLKLKATADLTTTAPEFAAAGCTISKAKLFCVPAGMTNLDPADSQQLTVNGQELQNAYICYGVKCPTLPPDSQVADDFGVRTETHFQTSFVCAPAIQGTPTTTTTVVGQTTTTTLLPATCGAAAYPECNGPCSSPGSVCGDVGNGHCGCVSGAPACGSYQGPPTCGGTCPAATPWCKDISGTCSCSAAP